MTRTAASKTETRPLLLAIVASLLIAACSAGGPPTDVEEISFVPQQLGDGWEISTPQAQGLDPDVLAEAYVRAAGLQYMYAVLVVRNGYLVAEGYFRGRTAAHANYTASATKSYTSALVGIALREGYLTNLDQKMVDFFPELVPQIADPRKHDITLRHLLTMTAGYPIESQDGNPYWAQLTQGDNWVENAFMLPLVRDPGGQWEYSSGSTLLLAAIVARTSGMSALAFAEQYLFGPLEAPIPLWGQDPAGNYLGGWAMYITPRNMARFGRVYLEGGHFGNQQIVPAVWVDESLVGYNAVDWPMGALGECRYGYLWYAGTVGAYEVRMAWGHGGQIILLVPELNLVVVTATDADNSFSQGYNQSLQVFRFIADHIIASVVEVQ